MGMGCDGMRWDGVRDGGAAEFAPAPSGAAGDLERVAGRQGARCGCPSAADQPSGRCRGRVPLPDTPRVL